MVQGHSQRSGGVDRPGEKHTELHALLPPSSWVVSAGGGVLGLCPGASRWGGRLCGCPGRVRSGVMIGGDGKG